MLASVLAPLRSVTRVATMAIALGLVLTPVYANPLPGSFSDLVQKVAPSVVTITTEKMVDANANDTADLPFDLPPGSPMEKFFRDLQKQHGNGAEPKQKQSSLGSGFIISADGYVVTNNHVVEGAQTVKVAFAEGESFEAKVIGIDPKTDLALLKIATTKPLAFVEWGDSDTAKVGDWVLAVGNPFGLTSTVTTGIVSARGRNIDAGPFDDFLQIDASVNRGNSGGPTFDMNGKVVGVNTAIYSPNGGSVGIAFAIPSNVARKVVAELKSTGFIERGWLGVKIQVVSPNLADGMGMGKPRGAMISGLDPKGPAVAAGIKLQDVIINFDGEAIKEMHDLPRAVAGHKPGSTVSLVVWRDEKEVTLSVKLGTLPKGDTEVSDKGSDGLNEAPAAKKDQVVLGMHLVALDPASRKQFGIASDVKGVVISDVENNSAAGAVELRAGDVIRQVGKQEITSPKAVIAAVAEVKKAGRPAVLLLVNRQGVDLFVAPRFPAG